MPTPQVTTFKVVEGESSVVIRVNLLSNGSGELVNVPFFSPSDLVPPRANNRPTFRIEQMWYGAVVFDFSIGAGTLQPVNIWTVAKACDSHVDFRSFGGLLDQNVYSSPPDDDNGVLTISTQGFAQAGSIGTIVLALRKTNEPR